MAEHDDERGDLPSFRSKHTFLSMSDEGIQKSADKEGIQKKKRMVQKIVSLSLSFPFLSHAPCLRSLLV